jgi:hypothetical protein
MMLNPTLNRSSLVERNSDTIFYEEDRMEMSTIFRSMKLKIIPKK